MLIRIAIVIVILQIIVSLIYSTQSLKLNQQFTDSSRNKTSLNQSVEGLEIKLARLLSIDYLNSATPSAILIPITQTLNEP